MINKICATIDKNHIYNCTSKTIGRQGENICTQLEITLEDCLCDSWVYLHFEKTDGTTKVTEKLEIIDNVVTYDIGNDLLDMAGSLKVFVELHKDSGLVWKSSTKSYTVLKSFNGVDQIENKEDFITDAQRLLNEVEEGLTPTIGENENWFICGKDTGKTSRGKTGEKGETGFSPVVEIAELNVNDTKGTRVYITSETGRQEFFVPDGKDANLNIIKVDKSTDGEILTAITSGNPVCAKFDNGRTLWLKDYARYEESNRLNYALFSDGMGSISCTSGWKWTNQGVIPPTKNAVASYMTSRVTTPGDYSVTLDFMLTGDSTDATVWDDRDEGLYIRPLNDSTNPYIKRTDDLSRPYKYTVRLSKQAGVQLVYGGNSHGDYEGILGGLEWVNSVVGYKEGNGNLPKTFYNNTLYRIKIEKIDDTLRLKTWEVGTTEPAWQFSYSDKSIGAPANEDWDQYYTWGFEMSAYNKGADSESYILKDIKFKFRDNDDTPFWENVLLDANKLCNVFKISGRAEWGEYIEYPAMDGTYKVSLPVTNGLLDYGEAGQVAVSDGKGGIVWKTIAGIQYVEQEN